MVADSGFDESIHAPNRLRICGILRPLDGAEFSVLKDASGISEANVSKTIRNLVELGYVQEVHLEQAQGHAAYDNPQPHTGGAPDLRCAPFGPSANDGSAHRLSP
nr:helix-turn-helix domain-containing protein [Nesterenkonia halotolerans]